jgi:hypothetical protein
MLWLPYESKTTTTRVCNTTSVSASIIQPEEKERRGRKEDIHTWEEDMAGRHMHTLGARPALGVEEGKAPGAFPPGSKLSQTNTTSLGVPR